MKNSQIKFFIYFLILLISLYYSMTISTILSLFAIILFSLFLKNISKIFFFYIFFFFITLIFFYFNYYIVVKILSRLEDLFQFIQYLNSLTQSELLNLTTEDVEKIKSSYGTYVARLNDLKTFIKCYQVNLLGLLFFGCPHGYDYTNLGYVNLFLDFGVFPTLIFLFYIIKITITGYKVFQNSNKSNIEFNIIYVTFCLIVSFFFLFNFISKIIEISVINYLVFIIYGYLLKHLRKYKINT
jgi:hypothetical protein